MDTKKFKMGWMIVAFDLPVKTKKQRKLATEFRNYLIKDGFLMIQYSVYARPCVSFARQQTHVQRLKSNLPEEGCVRSFMVTRWQWEHGFILYGAPAKKHRPEQMPSQYMLW